MPKRPEDEKKGPPRRLGMVSQMIANKATALEESDTKNNEALLVSMDRVRTNPRQPRKVYDAERDAELAENIRENGVLEPILVREVEGGFEIVAGERRFRAARLAGKTVIPVIVKAYDDHQAQLVAVVENLQRQDLAPLDEANYFKFLSDNYNYSYRKIAGMVHRSYGYVNDRMRLLNLDDDLSDSEKDNKRQENGQKLENSQTNKEQATAPKDRFTPRPLYRFESWLEQARSHFPAMEETARVELKEKLSDLKKKISALEKELG